MKTPFKNIRNLFLIILLSGTGSSILAQPDEHMDRFHDEKVNFFNEKLDLSESEAKLFWPVQEDFHNRNMKINEDERTLLNYYSNNYEAMSEKEIDDTIEKFMGLQKKRLELTTQYHDTFVKIIGKKKTMKMYSLDREFRMYILRKFRSGGEGGGGRGQYHGPKK